MVSKAHLETENKLIMIHFNPGSVELVVCFSHMYSLQCTLLSFVLYIRETCLCISEKDWNSKDHPSVSNYTKENLHLNAMDLMKVLGNNCSRK